MTALQNFAAYLLIAVAATALFMLLYAMITPYRERELLRQGNVAAGVSLSGVMLGFALPIASALMHSVSLTDLSIWALVAGIVQLLGYYAFRWIFRELRAQIEAGQLALPLLYAATAVCLGLLNAAAMSD
ncbi:DUF350 domain-containing protein [Ahniella affigens]|nr:DUF350 domain-containing protein [Ahniella affigens]